MSMEGINPAFLAAMNNPNKGMGARPLALLPALDGMPIMKDFSGPLWTNFSLIGGAKKPCSMSALIGDFPQQVSASEWTQMTCSGVENNGFVQPMPTPSGGGGGGGMGFNI